MEFAFLSVEPVFVVGFVGSVGDEVVWLVILWGFEVCGVCVRGSTKGIAKEWKEREKASLLPEIVMPLVISLEAEGVTIRILIADRFLRHGLFAEAFRDFRGTKETPGSPLVFADLVDLVHSAIVIVGVFGLEIEAVVLVVAGGLAEA